MATITITEALQDIKTTKARLAKKRQSVTIYLARDKRILDPMFEQDGGSQGFITRERQGIGDLEERLIKLRTAIQKANLDSVMAVGDLKRTIAEWLSWRRDVMKDRTAFLGGLNATIQNARTNAVRAGGGVTEDAAPAGGKIEIVINVSEAALAKEIEDMEKLTGDLDGRLSLFNATTTVEVPD